ncbi:MAG: SDR family NAD(P)-dependent oxidoreductase, partial [Christensenellaceae bacterium]
MNVMITGASGGLGRAMAMECARRGWKMYLADVNSGGVDSIKIGLERRFGAEVYTRLCDITCSDDVDNMIAELSASGVRLDMLLN